MTSVTPSSKMACAVCGNRRRSNHIIPRYVRMLLEKIPSGTLVRRVNGVKCCLPSTGAMKREVCLCWACHKQALSIIHAYVKTKNPRRTSQSTGPCGVCNRHMKSNSAVSAFHRDLLANIPEGTIVRKIAKKPCIFPRAVFSRYRLSLCNFCKTCALRKAAGYFTEQSILKFLGKKRKRHAVAQDKASTAREANKESTKPRKKLQRVEHNAGHGSKDIARGKPSSSENSIRANKGPRASCPRERKSNTAANNSNKGEEKCTALLAQKSAKALITSEQVSSKKQKVSLRIQNYSKQMGRLASTHQHLKGSEVSMLSVERERIRLERERLQLEFKYRGEELKQRRAEREELNSAELQKWTLLGKLADNAALSN